MNIENYTYLLANPQKITPADVVKLDQLLQKHPYFQSARALQLKGLKIQESHRYNEALKLTAAHTSDRDILFEYITSEKFIQNDISQTILQHDTSVMHIEVVLDDLSEQLSIEENESFDAERQKADAILNPDLFERKVTSVKNLIENTQLDVSEVKEEAETKLDVDVPLEFTKSDTHSFSEWLRFTTTKPIERQIEQTEPVKTASLEELPSEATSEERDRKFELIDKFIQERPKIIPDPLSGPSEKNKKPDTSEVAKHLLESYSQSSNSLMTETLAKVYLQQKNYKKAIQAYKILILKNPEKSGFFADQIRAIEKLINPEAQ